MAATKESPRISDLNERTSGANGGREQWDAIVIGSGLGGLSCAAYLCAAGKRTLVLESHYVAGGNSQTFRREPKGKLYEFDVGLHYIGECGPEGLITRVMRGAGLDGRVSYRQLESRRLLDAHIPRRHLPRPRGLGSLQEALAGYVPARSRSARQGRRHLDQSRRRQPPTCKAVRCPRRRCSPSCRCSSSGASARSPISFASSVISERASAVILGEQGDYAVRPSRTAVALHAGLTDHYMRGAYYPEGGGQMLAARLVEAIRAYGGEVRVRSRVRNVRIENGRAVGVTSTRAAPRSTRRSSCPTPT